VAVRGVEDTRPVATRGRGSPSVGGAECPAHVLAAGGTRGAHAPLPPRCGRPASCRQALHRSCARRVHGDGTWRSRLRRVGRGPRSRGPRDPWAADRRAAVPGACREHGGGAAGGGTPRGAGTVGTG